MNIKETVAAEVTSVAHKVTETAKAELGKLDAELKTVETKLHDAVFGSDAAPTSQPTEASSPVTEGQVEAKA